MARPSEIYRPDLLSGQVVLVTGGGSGIGRAIALEAAQLGARVAIGARKVARLEETADAIRAAGGECWFEPVDIRDDEAVGAWVQSAWDHHGQVDVLVNNAGGQFPAQALDITAKGWRAVVDTNLNGTFFVAQAVGRRMIKAGRPGRVINIIANMWRGFPGMAHTGAARAGVANLTRTLALEWAKHGVLVNAIAPGVIRSSGLDTYPEEIKRTVLAEVAKHIPLKHLGEIEDVAWAVIYLASPAGRYVTGETLCVDGGQAHWGMPFPI